ncbi:N-acetylmuramoyl-L-alanine amidase [Telmatospirillum sp.]|uniref:N-acetylmuramoyl-L-alanine amidase n=1 Tax=Telmatospirillum sp. TaxID=2079197 RepID=UPI00283AED5C|nr:N-acetylmuramoyl-L-alanine amidase [Telmatospirillum sp.]MDR3435781.1 N-acetylmuramoyl-L-alanine amidase [Telmatospirillum sp.]
MILCPSPNFDQRPADVPVDMLVLHYTGMPDRDRALARLLDPAAEVSAHYLIDEDGTCYRLVGEDFRAWHAGRSAWRGFGNVNARSVGIELVNPGHEFGYRPFPDRQMAALIDLAQGILRRHPIPPRNVVGHSDVAPRRKEDPGEFFNWKALAEQGIGVWPTVSGNSLPAGTVDDWRDLLAAWGYDIVDQPGESGEAGRAALVAFQRHFRPARFDGVADAETIRTLRALPGML